MASASVRTSRAWIQGRNGLYDITRISVWCCDDQHVFIDGIGKRNMAINGGFGSITAEEMDELCRAWLESREQETKT